MKFFIVGLLLFIGVFEFIDAVGYIQNTKIEDCSNDDGNCSSMCQFENLKLLPGTEEVNDGKCRKVKCNHDFSVIVK